MVTREEVATGGVAAAIGTTLANVLAYGLSLAGARLLPPSEYGVLVALLAVSIVASVPSLALQAVVAVRMVRAAETDRDRVAAESVGLGLAAGAALVLAGLVAAPLLDRFLHLGGPAPALWVAVTVGAITVLGVLQGVAQGRQDFLKLSMILVVYAAGRLVGGVGGLLLTDHVAGTLAGVAVGSFAAAGVAWVLTGRPRPVRGGWRTRELVVASQALAGLYLLTNLDPVLARHYLPAAEAGLYGAGAVMAKAAFFLPQAVVLVLFPKLASSPRPGRTLWAGVAALAALGLAMTGVAKLAGGLAVTAVGGDAYQELAGDAWLFVAVGSALVMVQLLLYAQLTAARSHVTLAVWAVVAAEAVVVATVAHGSLTAVVGTALGTALVAAAAGLLWALRTSRAAERDPVPAAVPSTD